MNTCIYKILHGQVYLPHNVQKFPSAETVRCLCWVIFTFLQSHQKGQTPLPCGPGSKISTRTDYYFPQSAPPSPLTAFLRIF